MDNKDKIIFSVPDLENTFHIVAYLIEDMKNKPERFYDDIAIGSVYGSFPCIWNGGRQNLQKPRIPNPQEIKKKIEFLNENGITARYTFTNLFIKGDRLEDPIGNNILETTRKYQTMHNEVNIASEPLREYIEANYPEFNTIYSTTLCLKDIDEINRLSATHLVVPDYELNNQFDLLAKLEHPENIELLANELCIEHCPKRHFHYEEISKYILGIRKEPCQCFFNNGGTYNELTKRRSHHIHPEDMRTRYKDLGLRYFKLTGRRSSPIYLAEGIVEYFVVPEWKDEVRQEILLMLWKDLI